MWGIVLAVLAVIAACVRYAASAWSVKAPTSHAEKNVEAEKASDAAKTSLKWRYLVVMLAVKFADWLQGPYFYELYVTKIDSRTGSKFTPGAVSTLFLVGFCSSMVFGIVAGALTDSFGRKLGCMFCAAIYVIETLMVESDSYGVLFTGRMLAGLASSLLHSVFESWVASEAKRIRASDAWLSDLFGIQWFGDGIVAVIAGVVAEALYGVNGPIAVFRASATCLAISFGLILTLWGENTQKSQSVGTPTASPSSSAAQSHSSASSNVMESVRVMFTDSRIGLLALIQCLFEGSMYSFVLVWVPTMRHSVADPSALPFGIIFACFMVCIMIGSGTFSLILVTGAATVSVTLLVVMALASVAFFGVGAAISNPVAVSAGFLLFEFCCGLYFPCSSTVRSVIIPGQLGSTLRSLFRVPLNIFVIGVLMNFESLGETQIMLMCGAALVVATVLQNMLRSAHKPTHIRSPTSS